MRYAGLVRAVCTWILAVCLLAFSGCARAREAHELDCRHEAQNPGCTSVVAAVATARRAAADSDVRTSPYALCGTTWVAPPASPDRVLAHHAPIDYGTNDAPPPSSRGPPRS